MEDNDEVIAAIERDADAEGNALLSPMPTVLVRALSADPSYVKCPRCWHYHTVKANYDGLCDRCCSVLIDAWPDHESVPHIIASRAAQQAEFSPRGLGLLRARLSKFVERIEARLFPNLIHIWPSAGSERNGT